MAKPSQDALNDAALRLKLTVRVAAARIRVSRCQIGTVVGTSQDDSNNERTSPNDSMKWGAVNGTIRASVSS